MLYCHIRSAPTVPCFFAAAVQGGSVGIRIAYSACFGPSIPRSNLHRSILGRFLQQYANCRIPVSRQAGDWCGICRRMANYRSMDSLGKRRSMAGWHGFWTRTACMGVAWQPRRGSRPQVRLPPRRGDGRTEPCRNKLSLALGSAMGSDMASAAVKTSYNVLPSPTGKII